jgi:hypothetical protein
MSTFEPHTIIAILKLGEKKNFDKNWLASVSSQASGMAPKYQLIHLQVEKRVTSWKTHRQAQSQSEPQLVWNAHIIEYVNYLYDHTSVHGNCSKGTIADSLPQNVPILGPRFVPPSYLHVEKRQKCPMVQPATAYIKPLNVVHPFYYPTISQCPQCDSANIKWDSWTPTGHREVHGIRLEECAIGFQMRCNDCEILYGKG